MKHHLISITLLLLAATLVAGCAGAVSPTVPPAEETPPPPSEEPTIPAITPPAPTEPVGGPVEDRVSLIEALQSAGATVEPAGAITQDFFSVPGQMLTINGEAVQVYEYADPLAAEAEAARVSADGSTITTSSGAIAHVDWVAAPRFYRAGRLIVLYVGSAGGVISTLDGTLGRPFAGSTGATTPTPTGLLVTGTAVVEDIDILILESFPVQVHVVARGYTPDGCTEIDQALVERQDDTFRVTITTVRPANVACIDIIRPFEQTIPLDVLGLPAGTYSVDVNGVRGTFTLATDNVLPR